MSLTDGRYDSSYYSSIGNIGSMNNMLSTRSGIPTYEEYAKYYMERGGSYPDRILYNELRMLGKLPIIYRTDYQTSLAIAELPKVETKLINRKLLLTK